VRGYQDKRQPGIALQMGEKLHPIHPGKAIIAHDAAARARGIMLKEGICPGVCANLVSSPLEDRDQRFAHRIVIFNDVDQLGVCQENLQRQQVVRPARGTTACSKLSRQGNHMPTAPSWNVNYCHFGYSFTCCVHAAASGSDEDEAACSQSLLCIRCAVLNDTSIRRASLPGWMVRLPPSRR